MVTPNPTPRGKAASSPRGRRGMLDRKLWRDMRHSAMQFLAMMLLCALGTWVFSGLDGTWRMLDRSIETYFDQCHLADLWVKGSAFSKQDLSRLRLLPGVEAIQARATAEYDAPDLGDGVTLNVHAYDGEMIINTPLIRQGEALAPTDLKGCLLEEQFAQAHGLHVGDALTLSLNGQRKTYVIRGIVMSAEYVVTAKDVSPDPTHYGFALISSQSTPELPLNDVAITLADSADETRVMAEIQSLMPETLVLSQKTHASTVTGRNYTDMFHSLTYVFPLLAYGVAALIVVTTLTRMIENQRVQMGTLKALGFRKHQIRMHYLAYAFYPSLVGSLLGVVVGQYTLPDVLWPIVTTNARLPYQLRPPISILAWGMTALSVALSVLICLHAYNKAARETTASLLRPKPPKSGSRILLERIPFLWRRFSFNAKMITRNLMRSKGRTFISLVGIICCNMLIICTFGLQDSISYFISEYYDGTLQYDVRADLDPLQAGRLESYQVRLGAEAGTVDGIMEQSISLRSGDDSRATLLTVLPPEQTSIYLGKGHKLMEMPDRGVVISQKLCEVMGIRVGDTVEILLPGDNDALCLTVHDTADTNIGQGVFMGKAAWESLRKGDFRVTALLITNPSDMCSHRLDEMDEVTALKYPPQQILQSMRIMDSTAMAFSILSGAALGLAFVICYNMGLMNFTERTRDYATLKVLGYHQKEIRRLMLRENDITALLGVLLGIPPGILLVDVILKSCEYESMVFASRISWPSILLSCAITFVFTWMIEWLLTRKVRSIDMVEALKSVE